MNKVILNFWLFVFTSVFIVHCVYVWHILFIIRPPSSTDNIINPGLMGNKWETSHKNSHSHITLVWAHTMFMLNVNFSVNDEVPNVLSTTRKVQK